LVLRFVPSIQPAGGQRFDFAGGLTLLASLLSMLLALSLSQQSGFTDRWWLALLGAGAGSLLLFVWIERRVAQPMVDLELFRNRLFSISLITALICFIAMAGTNNPDAVLPARCTGIRHPPGRLAAGRHTVVVGGDGAISGNLSDRLGVRPITMVGLAVMLGGFLAVSTLGTQTTALGYALRFIPWVWAGIFQSPNNSAIMGAAPRGRLGIVSACWP